MSSAMRLPLTLARRTLAPRAAVRAAAPARSFASSPRRLAEASGSADAKLVGIVDQVEKLTLLEAAELVSLLKVRFSLRRRSAGSRQRQHCDGGR
jgi:large subunit ribosomal protein L7/L12